MSAPSEADSRRDEPAEEARGADSREKAKRLLEEQKDAGAERLDGVARAIGGAGDQLAQEMPQTAQYIRGAASSLREASASLRERKVGDLLGAVGDFACRQPAVFFGGAVIAGLALTRLLSPPREHAADGKDRR